MKSFNKQQNRIDKLEEELDNFLITHINNNPEVTMSEMGSVLLKKLQEWNDLELNQAQETPDFD